MDSWKLQIHRNNQGWQTQSHKKGDRFQAQKENKEHLRTAAGDSTAGFYENDDQRGISKNILQFELSILIISTFMTLRQEIVSQTSLSNPASSRPAGAIKQDSVSKTQTQIYCNLYMRYEKQSHIKVYRIKQSGKLCFTFNKCKKFTKLRKTNSAVYIDHLYALVI